MSPRRMKQTVIKSGVRGCRFLLVKVEDNAWPSSAARLVDFCPGCSLESGLAVLVGFGRLKIEIPS